MLFIGHPKKFPAAESLALTLISQKHTGNQLGAIKGYEQKSRLVITEARYGVSLRHQAISPVTNVRVLMIGQLVVYDDLLISLFWSWLLSI